MRFSDENHLTILCIFIIILLLFYYSFILHTAKQIMSLIPIIDIIMA